jgi:hypothetical protein
MKDNHANSIFEARQLVLKRMSPCMPARDPRIKAQLEVFDGLDPQLLYLVCNGDSELVDLANASVSTTELEMPDPALGPTPTAAERQELETQVLLERMGLGEISTPPDPVKWLRARGTFSNPVPSVDEIADNVLAIARMAVDDPDAAKVLAKYSRTEPAGADLGDEFVRTLAARALEFEPDPGLAEFLSGYAIGDERSMREAIRRVVVAER